MLRNVQITIDDALLRRVDRATQKLGIPRSDFVRQALELSLRNLAMDELERQHRAGYRRTPVAPGEFDLWETEQAWGDQ